jgi:hypothetical protein
MIWHVLIFFPGMEALIDWVIVDSSVMNHKKTNKLTKTKILVCHFADFEAVFAIS